MIPYDLEFPINCTEEDDEEDCELLEELSRLLEKEKKEIKIHQESVKVINLGTEEARKEVKIGESLEKNAQKELVELLQEYVDIFSWSNQYMPGLDTNIVMHKLPL